MSDVKDEETPQQRFDRMYISSLEIITNLDVTRSTISQARRRGMLPDAIVSHGGSMVLWERDRIKPNLDAWALTLRVRRHETA